MRRLGSVAILLAVCLAGCSANQDFEKDILGHPAPPYTPSGGPMENAPPPPPPAPSAPAPAYPEPDANPAPEPAPASAQATPPPAPAPASTPAAPQTQQYTPKPFTPAPAAPAQQPAPPAAQKPAGAPQPKPAPAAAPHPAAAHAPGLTFQVGSFAHAANAKELAGKLESQGYKTHVEQGEVNNRKCFNVFATKSGSRAALEGELFASGVAEPALVEEPHPAPEHPATAKTPGKATKKKHSAKTGAAQSQQPATKAQPSGN